MARQYQVDVKIVKKEQFETQMITTKLFLVEGIHFKKGESPFQAPVIHEMKGDILTATFKKLPDVQETSSVKGDEL